MMKRSVSMPMLIRMEIISILFHDQRIFLNSINRGTNAQNRIISQ